MAETMRHVGRATRVRGDSAHKSVALYIEPEVATKLAEALQEAVARGSGIAVWSEKSHGELYVRWDLVE